MITVHRDAPGAMNTRVDLVIVGGGPAAIHLVAELGARASQGQARLPRSICVIDPHIRAAGGSAHSDTSAALRVNMRVELHDMPGQIGFKPYLRLHGGDGIDPPLRADLGRYLDYVTVVATRDLQQLGYVMQHVRDEVRRLDRAGSDYHLLLGSGHRIVATSVVLATGNPAPSVPPTVCVPESAVASRRITLYDGGSGFAQQLRADDRLLVLGTGPGGVDVARVLIEDVGASQTIDLVSRTGMLSAVQTPLLPPPTIVADVEQMMATLRGPLSLTELAARLWPLFERHAPEFDPASLLIPPTDALANLSAAIALAIDYGPPWRHVVDVVGAHAPAIWAALLPAARAEFLSRWMRSYYVARHAMPLATAEWLKAQLEQGRIHIGRLHPDTKVQVTAHGISAIVDYLPGETVESSYDALVLATGPEYRVTRTTNPLIRQLVAEGLALPSMVVDAQGTLAELGGVLTANLEVIGLPHVYGMGAVVRGEYLATHAFPALAQHARLIVDQLTRLT